jgi:hypothetical protein
LDNYSGCRKKVGDSPDIFNLRAPLGKWEFLQHFNILAVFQAIKWDDKSQKLAARLWQHDSEHAGGNFVCSFEI